ncbi:apoptosis-associated speck-like protein containing a CARD [Stigmatopora argus]
MALTVVGFTKMASKKKIILDSLDNLSKENYARFCLALVDRKGEPKVPLSQVEDQPRSEVKSVLVSYFTKAGAPAIVSELLKDIGCPEEADHLVSVQHFVDKHKLQLIQRVTNIDPILDGLLERHVLLQQGYQEISQTAEKQNKMRKIYQLALKSGDTAKDVFMELLRQEEAYLVKDILKDP